MAGGCAGNAGTVAGGSSAATAESSVAVQESSSKAEESSTAGAETTSAGVAESSLEEQKSAAVLEDGMYTAEFDSDSSMFHVNEACEGKGTLTVKDGEMMLHISLPSKNIVNLFVGLAEDAQKEGAKVLEPTLDTVTYKDGMTEEVYGYDIPVPVLDEEFDLALLGKKGTWYDHKVSVSNQEKTES